MNVIKKSFEDLRIKFPDKIPVVLQLSPDLITKYNIKTKILLQYDANASDILWYLRNKIKIESSQAIFIYVNNQLLIGSQPLYDIWFTDSKRKTFLFVEVCLENTFG